MSSTQAKPEYKAYENGVEISIPANGEKDRWYMIANGQRVAVITEWADGFSVDGEVTSEIRSFIAELQAANRAERDAAAPTVKESSTVRSIPTPKPAATPAPALRGFRIVGGKNRHEAAARAEKAQRLATALAGHISADDAKLMDDNCWKMAAQIARVAMPSVETRQAVIAALAV